MVDLDGSRRVDTKSSQTDTWWGLRLPGHTQRGNAGVGVADGSDSTWLRFQGTKDPPTGSEHSGVPCGPRTTCSSAGWTTGGCVPLVSPPGPRPLLSEVLNLVHPPPALPSPLCPRQDCTPWVFPSLRGVFLQL